MCLMIRLLVSRPLVSALASAFLRRPMRISADLTGQRALETPKALPTEVSPNSCDSNSTRSTIHDASSSSESLSYSVYVLSLGPLTLRSASSAASVPPHGDSLLVLQDISEVGEGALELPAVDSLGGLAGVLEGNAEVAAAGASRLCAFNGRGSVANLPLLISHSACNGLRRKISAADVPFCRCAVVLVRSLDVGC
jgi:hypothetical protein